MFKLFQYLVINPYTWLWLACALWLTKGIFWPERPLNITTALRTHWLRFLLLLFFWVMGTPFFVDNVLVRYESSHKKPPIEQILALDSLDIVVLTAGGVLRLPKETPVEGLRQTTTIRLAAALELAMSLEQKPNLIFTGRNRDAAIARYMQDYTAIVCPDLHTLVDSTATSTATHPAGIRDLLRSDKFVLVTSALHMPRSMKVFQKAGYDPIPYPVDRMTFRVHAVKDFIPGFLSMALLTSGIHELIGVIWYHFRGYI